jgi:hypothetical protein
MTSKLITRAEYMENVGKDPDIHDKYYGQFVVPLVKEYVRRTLGECILRSQDPKNFSDIPLRVWDSMHGVIVKICNAKVTEAQGYGMSLSDSVCIAKAAARRIVREA